MPDWSKVEEDYLKSVRNGRHPISFKRKGELWYHCEVTNQRLARVSKGHKLLTVLGESKYYDVEEHESAGLSGRESPELARGSAPDARAVDPQAAESSSAAASEPGSRQITPSKPPTSSLKIPVKMSDKDRAMIASVLGPQAGRSHTLDPIQAQGTGSPDHLRSLIDFQLNGVNIDVRFKSALNYGQLVVIMNEANEVLCVDNRNVIRIKGKHNLAMSDKICFKMVDLRMMSNPSEIRYGEPVWFQAVETSPGASVDSNFFSSSVLGCKIFQLATIATQQLNENWANSKNKQREKIFKREEEVDSDEEYERRMAEIERKEKQAAEAAAFRPKSKGRGWGALKKAPVKETLEKVKKVSKKLEQKKHAEDLDEQADNKDLVGEVCGSSFAVRLAHNTEGANVDQGLASEVVSKEAMNLGLFVPLSADNPNRAGGDEVPKAGSVLLSNRRIYLCQDLYCLANSVGSTYVPWPLHARDFSQDTQAHNPSSQEGEGHGSQPGLALSQQPHHGKGLQKAPAKVRGKRGKRERNRDGEFGVLRRVVKRGEEYEFNIDRKCVWRLCHVDNLSDAHQMTTAELTTAKVMATAKETLRKSEILRKGGKSYKGSHWMEQPPSPAAARIPGGEKFSLALRTDVSSHLLSKESGILASRREKEQVLKSFVEAQVSNWDPPGNAAFPEDVRSMRSQMSFEYIKPKINMEIGSGAGGDDVSLGSGSLQSNEENEVARIMLPVGREQAHAQAQSAILKRKTLGLRSYHYQQYPYFYKSPQKTAQSPTQASSPRTLSPLELSKTTYRKHFPFNAGLISAGERVLALRQAFGGIERHELDTLAANGGVDDSIEKRWKSAIESSDVTDGKERPSMQLGASRRNIGFEDSDDEGKEDEESHAAARRLIIERKIQILQSEDDLVWAAAKHQRKVEAARLIEESIQNMDEDERKRMEEQLRARSTSAASMSSEHALFDT